MKITKVDVLVLDPGEKERAVRKPVGCRIHTDAGIYGDGEAGVAYGVGYRAAYGMIKDLAELIIGKDPMQVEAIWEMMLKDTFWGQSAGSIFFSGMSAIDIALMDIKGKALNVPCYELLGGLQNDNLRVYASQIQSGWITKLGHFGKPEEYVAITDYVLEEGYDAIKIDFGSYDSNGKFLGSKRRADLCDSEHMKVIEERMAAIREKYPKLDILCENHAQTSVPSAIKTGLLCDKYNMFCMEEPTTTLVPELHKVIAEKIKTPLAGGERIFSRWQFYNFLKDHSIQLVQPDVCTCGGITETKKVCDLAHIFDAKCQVHVAGGPISTVAALQVEAAIPNFCIHEHHFRSTQPGLAALGKYDYQPQNGRYEIPKLPGIGNELSTLAFETALEASTVE